MKKFLFFLVLGLAALLCPEAKAQTTSKATNGIFTNLTAERYLKGCDASFYFGSDDGAKIQAAANDSNCTFISALNLVTLTGASPVSIPNNKHVILPCGLYVGATTAFSIGNVASLQGSGENCTIISTNSATANIVDIPSPNQWWYLSDFSIRSEVARSAGAGIGCHGGNGIAERIAVYPVFDGLWCDTAAISDNNTFRHMQFTDGTGTPSAGLGGTWHAGVRVGGVSSGTVSGNTFDDITIPMHTAFTDAGIAIQDGADTTTVTHSQAVANVGGSDSVAVHIETVNGGLAPTITKFISDEFEGGLTKNAVVVDANVGAGLEFTNVNTNSSLRGYLINTGSSIHILGGQIYSNQQEGIRAAAFSDLQVIGARFGNNSQQTNVTFDDIFVAANQGQFKIIGNTFSDFSNTGKFSKFNVEVAAGTSNFYDISNNLFLPTGTGALNDGGTGLAKHVCNLNTACNMGNSSFQQMGATSGTVTVQPAAIAGTPTITWPISTGTLGELSGTQTFFEACSGTASAGTTLAMQWSGGACSSSATALQVPTSSAGTLLNMRVKCGTAGTNASSGAFTLNKNGSTATALTCTVGTGTTCNDTTHTVAAVAGDNWQVFFTTQAAETLANCAVSWEKQ